MALEWWQAQIDPDDNGLVLGCGTQFEFERLAGLERPALKDADLDLAGEHGIWLGPDRYGGRTIAFRVLIRERGQEDAFAALADLEEAWTVGDEERLLAVCLPVFPFSDDTAFFFGRCRALVPDLSLAVKGLIPVALVFQCGDPRAYGPTRQQTSTSSTAIFGVNVFGNTPTRRWEATFPVGSVGPRVSHDGHVIDMDGTTVSGDPIIVDGWTKTITQDGTSVYGAAASADWFELSPGSQSLTLARDSGSGTWVFRWRDAWL